MPLLTEEAGLVSAPTVVLFSLLNETIFVSEILFQDRSTINMENELQALFTFLSILAAAVQLHSACYKYY